MRWLDEQAIGYAISADMSPQLSQCIAALPEDHWKLDREATDAIVALGPLGIPCVLYRMDVGLAGLRLLRQ